MRPLVPVALSFLSGVFISERLGWSYGLVPAALLISIIMIALAYQAGLRFNRLVHLPAFFFAGALFIIPYSRPEFPPAHILNRVQSGTPENSRTGHVIEGRVLQLEHAGKRTRLYLAVEKYLGPAGWEDAEGKAFITVNGRADFMPGDRVRTMALLQEPASLGNPGEFDYRRWLNRRGVFVTGFVKSERLIERASPSGSALAPVHAMRGAIGSFIDSSGLRNREGLKALIISGQGGIDRGLRDAFAVTGTAHILSISGLHVGMVAAFSYGLFLFLLKRSETLVLALSVKKAALALSAAPVLVYGMLAGFPTPTQRAVLMVLAFTASFAIGRGRDYLNTLALAALIIMALAPYSVWDISFQLTFAAMASIIILVPLMEGLFKKDKERGKKAPSKEGGKPSIFFRRRVFPMVLVTVAAGIGTSPLLAYHFHRVSLVGLAANLVVVPLSGVIVPSLLISSAVLPVSSALALVPLHIADFFFSVMAVSTRFFATIPYASLWVSPPRPHETALFYALVICAAGIKGSRAFRYAAPAVGLLLITSLWGGGFLPDRDAPGVLRVTFLSVGQGDASFIEFPDGRTMLVDGGGGNNPDFDTGERVIAPFLRTKGVKKLDYMLLSHPQQDHMGGLPFIVENFRVDEFWWNGDGGLGELGDALMKKGVRVRTVSGLTGRKEVGGAAIEFLHPGEGAALGVNEMSVVIKVSYGEKSFLFTGDIGEKAEALLEGLPVAATVLKSPHHGSKNSSTPGFLAAVRPSVVVISAGRRNAHGLPHQEAIDRYSAAGAAIMRTDTGGAAVFETDGRRLDASAYLTGGGL